MVTITNDMHLFYLLVSGDATDEAWPKALRDVVGQPEPAQSRLVELVSDVERKVGQIIVGPRVDHRLRHQRRN